VAFSPGTDFSGAGLMVATQFPEAITMSAAFDDDLIVKVGQVIGTEARAFANGGRAGLDFWYTFLIVS
jgi:beta-D-xylosidase 4